MGDFIHEPGHDKTNKVSMRPAKTQISWADRHFVGFVMSRLTCIFQIPLNSQRMHIVEEIVYNATLIFQIILIYRGLLIEKKGFQQVQIDYNIHDISGGGGGGWGGRDDIHNIVYCGMHL